MTTFNLPDLGEGLQEAEIVAWHVAEGDHVVADQPLVAVETEKAVVEIPSPQAGHVAKLLAPPGAHVRVGAPLLQFEEGPHHEAGAVVGELAESPPHGPGPAASPPPSRRPAEPVRAAPAARARARELGIDLAGVSGSGPGGAITIEDVMSARSAKPSPDDGEALRGVRRTMAVNMARAWREVAHASLHDEADIDSWPAGHDVTVRLIRALIAGCAAEPALNAGFDTDKLRLHRRPHIDVGIAMDSPDGLFVPVLRDVAGYAPEAWRKQIEALKQGVRERTLAPAQLRDPTITLSNFGTIAGQHAALIIMPPQVAILGAGRITARPVRAQGGAALHRMLPLSLSFDHRAVTGGQAGRFLRAIIADLETAT